MFYGILILLYYRDNKQHNTPHIHARYQNFDVSIDIENNVVIAGDLPAKQLKLVQAWIEIHNEDLMANWLLAVNGDTPFRIEPLR